MIEEYLKQIAKKNGLELRIKHYKRVDRLIIVKPEKYTIDVFLKMKVKDLDEFGLKQIVLLLGGGIKNEQ